MRMKLALTVACAVFLGTTLTVAQTKTTVFGGLHDISNAGCSGCHVPHQATARGQVLLWNQAFSQQSFGTYANDLSPTMDSVPVDIGDTYSATNLPTGAVQASVLCMSCHDGVTSPLIIAATDPEAVGNPDNSDGLRNDHPINMLYSAAGPGMVDEATVLTSAIELYSGTVQCGSCHNPHDNTITPFLRITNDNTAAGLCAACHS